MSRVGVKLIHTAEGARRTGKTPTSPEDAAKLRVGDTVSFDDSKHEVWTVTKVRKQTRTAYVSIDDRDPKSPSKQLRYPVVTVHFTNSWAQQARRAFGGLDYALARHKRNESLDEAKPVRGLPIWKGGKSRASEPASGWRAMSRVYFSRKEAETELARLLRSRKVWVTRSKDTAAVEMMKVPYHDGPAYWVIAQERGSVDEAEQLDEHVRRVKDLLQTHHVFDMGRVGRFRVYYASADSQHSQPTGKVIGPKDAPPFGTMAGRAYVRKYLPNLADAERKLTSLGMPRQRETLIVRDLSKEAPISSTGGGVGGYYWRGPHAIEVDLGMLSKSIDNFVRIVAHEWAHGQWFRLPKKSRQFFDRWYRQNVLGKVPDVDYTIRLGKHERDVVASRWAKEIGGFVQTALASEGTYNLKQPLFAPRGKGLIGTALKAAKGDQSAKIKLANQGVTSVEDVLLHYVVKQVIESHASGEIDAVYRDHAPGNVVPPNWSVIPIADVRVIECKIRSAWEDAIIAGQWKTKAPGDILHRIILQALPAEVSGTVSAAYRAAVVGKAAGAAVRSELAKAGVAPTEYATLDSAELWAEIVGNMAGYPKRVSNRLKRLVWNVMSGRLQETAMNEAKMGRPTLQAGYKWGKVLTWADVKRGDLWQGQIYPHAATVQTKRGDKVFLKTDYGQKVSKTRDELSKNGAIIRGKTGHQVKASDGSVFVIDKAAARRRLAQQKADAEREAARKAHAAKGRYDQKPKSVPPLKDWRHNTGLSSMPGMADETYTFEWRAGDDFASPHHEYMIYHAVPAPGKPERARRYEANYRKSGERVVDLGSGSLKAAYAKVKQHFAKLKESTMTTETDEARLTTREKTMLHWAKAGNLGAVEFKSANPDRDRAVKRLVKLGYLTGSDARGYKLTAAGVKTYRKEYMREGTYAYGKRDSNSTTDDERHNQKRDRQRKHSKDRPQRDWRYYWWHGGAASHPVREDLNERNRERMARLSQRLGNNTPRHTRKRTTRLARE